MVSGRLPKVDIRLAPADAAREKGARRSALFGTVRKPQQTTTVLI